MFEELIKKITEKPETKNEIVLVLLLFLTGCGYVLKMESVFILFSGLTLFFGSILWIKNGNRKGVIEDYNLLPLGFLQKNEKIIGTTDASTSYEGVATHYNYFLTDKRLVIKQDNWLIHRLEEFDLTDFREIGPLCNKEWWGPTNQKSAVLRFSKVTKGYKKFQEVGWRLFPVKQDTFLIYISGPNEEIFYNKIKNAIAAQAKK